MGNTLKHTLAKCRNTNRDVLRQLEDLELDEETRWRAAQQQEAANRKRENNRGVDHDSTNYDMEQDGEGKKMNLDDDTEDDQDGGRIISGKNRRYSNTRRCTAIVDHRQPLNEEDLDSDLKKPRIMSVLLTRSLEFL